MRSLISPASITICGAFIAAASGTAHGALSASASFITIKATSGSNTSTVVIPLADNPSDAFAPVDEYVGIPTGNFLFTGWDWAATSPFAVVDSNTNTTLLWVTQLGLTSGFTFNTMNGEQTWGHDFNFAVKAASSDVNIEVFTTVLSFTNVADPYGRSDTGFTITDTSGSPAGATVGGLLNNGYVFEATHDGTSTFRNYLDFDPAATVGPDGSQGYTGNMTPAGSFAPVGADVSSMQIRYNFSLTASDQASASSTWVIIPTPGAAGLIALGAIAAGTRRRR